MVRTWSYRPESDWSDCAGRDIWNELFEMVEAIREKWKTLEEAAEEIARATDFSKIECLMRLWEADEIKEAAEKFFAEYSLLFNCRQRVRKTRRRAHPNTTPLGTATYLYKAKEMKNLARSTKTGAACKGGVKNEQCRHTFEITRAQCAPCAGYNAECMDYEKNDAADTKHRSELS